MRVACDMDYTLHELLLSIFFMAIYCCTQNLIYPMIHKKEPAFTSTSMAIAAIVSNSIGACAQQIFGYIL